jgi:hypothetical protein
MKKFYLILKLWYFSRKFLKAKTTIDTLHRMQKISKTKEYIEKNKGSKLAAFIRQMKQR